MAAYSDSKLTIRAYKDGVYSEGKKADKEFTVMFNPNSYTRKFTISYDDQQGKGTTGSGKNLDRVKPGDLQIEFTIDGTGTVASLEVSKATAESSAPSDDPIDVQKKVDEFKAVCYDMDGDIHRPYFLLLVWGSLSIDCVLTSADIKYTLFDKAGKPLRATISATFSEAIADEPRAVKEGKSSPDLTHKRVVQEGDTLPLMTYRIYGDSKYYLQVAQVNGLKDFRNLQAGQVIYFPPIAKTTAQG
jgi:hypothetical protein